MWSTLRSGASDDADGFDDAAADITALAAHEKVVANR